MIYFPDCRNCAAAAELLLPLLLEARRRIFQIPEAAAAAASR